MYRIILTNTGKRRQRCPICWKVSPSASRGRPHWWSIYRCDGCRVRWLRLWGW